MRDIWLTGGALLLALTALTGCDPKDAPEDSDDPIPEDIDGDGALNDEDCDPENPDVYPGAPELEDWLDNNCDGTADEGTLRYDDDGDGVSDYEGDCDEADPTIYPGADEIPYDGVDQDCDGADLVDLDGDGFDALEAGGDDCDDTLASVFPGADEWANGVDDDCDGTADEETDRYDDDGDGFAESDGDCDDDDAAISPDAVEIPYDGIDQDCDLVDARDLDGDGFDGVEAGGEDCDDADAATYPDADEIPYDEVDQDCDGADLIDVDGDGMVPADGDCDDEEADVYDGAEEVADRLDNDCDGDVDEGTRFGDDDGDGYSEAEGDCDDDDPDRAPGIEELINGIDDDCNGFSDELSLDKAARIEPDDTRTQFGASLSAGDFNGDGVTDIAVGAFQDSAGASRAGHAWVISADSPAGTASDVALFSVASETSNAAFGQLLAFVPDMDGDGDDELLVAAPADATSSFRSREGVVYLIPGDSDGALGLAEAPQDIASDVIHGGSSNLRAPDGLAAGDWDGDGLGDFALSDESSQSSRGAVYLFSGAAGPGAFGEASLEDAADAVVTGEGTSDFLGSALHGLGDLDGDGYDELLLVARNERVAYLMDGDEVVAALAAGSLNARDIDARFRDLGASSNWGSAAASGDVDGDGDAELLLTNSTSEGAAFFFVNGGAGWTGEVQSIDADASVTGNFDAFGSSAAVGDVDGDGTAEFIIGASNYAGEAISAGGAFLFSGDLAALDGGVHDEVGRLVYGANEQDRMGASLDYRDGWWAISGQGGGGSSDGGLFLIPVD